MIITSQSFRQFQLFVLLQSSEHRGEEPAVCFIAGIMFLARIALTQVNLFSEAKF